MPRPTDTTLLGRYATLPFRCGDVVTCALRGEVTLVGLREAPIPWPVGKKPGQRTKALVLYAGLADAVAPRRRGLAVGRPARARRGAASAAATRAGEPLDVPPCLSDAAGEWPRRVEAEVPPGVLPPPGEYGRRGGEPRALTGAPMTGGRARL